MANWPKCEHCGEDMKRRNLDRFQHPDKVDRFGYCHEFYCPNEEAK
jgi:hypothetical protein